MHLGHPGKEKENLRHDIDFLTSDLHFNLFSEILEVILFLDISKTTCSNKNFGLELETRKRDIHCE